MARPQFADWRDGILIWTADGNILNKQSSTTDKWWHADWGWAESYKLPRQKSTILEKPTNDIEIWMLCSWQGYATEKKKRTWFSWLTFESSDGPFSCNKFHKSGRSLWTAKLLKTDLPRIEVDVLVHLLHIPSITGWSRGRNWGSSCFSSVPTQKFRNITSN
jgi:hypothetical protein